MTVGNRQYNEADLLQMQRDAEERVREMQNRARRTVEENTLENFTPRNRNWSSNPGTRRRRPGRGAPQPQGQPAPPPAPAEEAPAQQASPEPPPTPPPQAEGPREEGAEKKGTVIGDIMNALGLDEDYLLIIGLMLILLNQRADTTLILALAYLLI